MRNAQTYKLLDAAAVRAISSSTDATPIVVTTSTAHGLSTADLVQISGHTTNIAAYGLRKITKTGASAFSLQDPDTGNDIAGSGAGAGSGGVFSLAAKRVNVRDFRHVVLHFDTDGGGDAAFTVKLVGSALEDCPDFAAAQADDNQYDYIQMVDLEDGSAVDGDDGFVVATADDHRVFEANVNGLNWISVVPTAGSAGEITVTATAYENR